MTAVAQDTWLSQGERGSRLVIRTTWRIATFIGRPAMRPVVAVIALWYRLFDRRAVRASRAWLERVQGRPAGFWAVYRHLRKFAQVTLDRIFLVTGRTGAFSFSRFGQEHLMSQLETGRGAVLLGAHMGSYEALRAAGVAEDVPIQILGYFENAERINALLSELNPRQAANVIHVGSDPLGSSLKAQACVERGHLIAVLGDRVGLNDKVVEAEFFGQKARFPAGPFLLSSLLRCPVYLVFGLYKEPNHYDLSCVPFADGVPLPRKDRQEHIQALVQRYAHELERRCREAPDNWFNFFDFWSAP